MNFESVFTWRSLPDSIVVPFIIESSSLLEIEMRKQQTRFGEDCWKADSVARQCTTGSVKGRKARENFPERKSEKGIKTSSVVQILARLSCYNDEDLENSRKRNQSVGFEVTRTDRPNKKRRNDNKRARGTRHDLKEASNKQGKLEQQIRMLHKEACSVWFLTEGC
jgi:hypothetical protein